MTGARREQGASVNSKDSKAQRARVAGGDRIQMHRLAGSVS
jgi:hypothetical protein